MATPIIEAHNLTVLYGRKPAIWNVDFKLPEGQVIGIMGPNGSGKSTLLKSIMGVVAPTTGYTKVYDQDLNQVRHKVSYVPQRQEIDWDFPASVWDIVSMGRFHVRGLFKRLTSEDNDIIQESLEKVNMLGFAKRQISQLSGGQQQRVFLARAIAQQGELFLMDEPFAGVDIATEEMIVDLLKEMKDQGKTLVIVHHDLHTAQSYFDHLVLMNTRLVACGKTSDVFTDQILTDTYGGKLTTIAKISQELENKEFPIRHQ
ncbi:MAG: metal ABC transporter ATP-binding protein [Bacteroidia bacterium]|nr:metal ABC transporter ATP-binding protein [Bacteroidia bacterium]|tara:strand:+ start:9903 stop:10679 length:777 start_codon:yes stop_codon:yes gene_type:complete